MTDTLTSSLSWSLLTSSLSMLSQSSCSEVSCLTDTLFPSSCWTVEERRVGMETTVLLARLAGCRDHTVCIRQFRHNEVTEVSQLSQGLVTLIASFPGHRPAFRRGRAWERGYLSNTPPPPPPPYLELRQLWVIMCDRPKTAHDRVTTLGDPVTTP